MVLTEVAGGSAPPIAGAGPGARPVVHGKFLAAGGESLYIRGVTYGTFRPDAHGDSYPAPAAVEADFAAMVANGINAVRTYTAPPRWLLDTAQRHGLRVMVGLPWEQHVAFLEDSRQARSIEERVRAGVRACAGHPAVLCYAIGNEIPASIVRWHGARPVERFLERLFRAAKAEDPAGLVTYVNYPSTEYLQLPFLDLVCFNVYLENEAALDAYLARLQTIAGDRPLLLGELGLDSRRHGEETQAVTLNRQIRTAFAAGCVGLFVFAWTDEWHRGGYDVTDWDFGLADRLRRPKPALASVRAALADVPFPRDLPWPRISVVVCSRNGARTLRETLHGVQRVIYPDFEIILVDDGSTDATAAIGEACGVQVISTVNRGLSSARNTGMRAATGEIVAYLDDDAVPDPHWLTYLAASFMTTDYVAVGGPNLPPPGDGPIADCVANAPGGPMHVLVSDREAEHLPGCNLAVRRDALNAIGGFDSQFRVAGDDVDLCWRLHQRGWTLGFNPAAVVWHHRRSSLRGYWRQQYGYGKAEALLERKWPEKFNPAGHLTWCGRLYAKGVTPPLPGGARQVHYGVWGSGLFQSVYAPAPDTLRSLPLMPEWYLLIAALAGCSLLGLLWTPLFFALPFLAGALGAVLVQAALGAARATFTSPCRSRRERWLLRLGTAFLHLLQPLARLAGRQALGLTPWRVAGGRRFALPTALTAAIWSARWQAGEDWLRGLQGNLSSAGARVVPAGPFDRWDLEVRGGLFGAARLLLAVEEHGSGKQLIRVHLWPHIARPARMLAALFALLSGLAVLAGDRPAEGIFGLLTLLVLARLLGEAGAATGVARDVLEQVRVAEWRRASARPGRRSVPARVRPAGYAGGHVRRSPPAVVHQPE